MPDYLAGCLVEFLIGLPIAFVEMAIIEFSLHRWLMHRRQPMFRSWFAAHSAGHHRKWGAQLVHPGWTYGTSEKDPSYGVLKSSPGWILFAIFVSWPLALAFVVVCFLQGVGWRAVHREFHVPSATSGKPGVWWARTRLFRFLRDRHERHHQNQSTCYGVLFAAIVPVDWCMGTLH